MILAVAIKLKDSVRSYYKQEGHPCTANNIAIIVWSAHAVLQVSGLEELITKPMMSKRTSTGYSVKVWPAAGCITTATAIYDSAYGSVLLLVIQYGLNLLLTC